MHSNGTPTNLDSIQDQIVVLATYLDKIRNGISERRSQQLGMRSRMQMLTSDIRPLYSACTSCHAGAVKG